MTTEYWIERTKGAGCAQGLRFHISWPRSSARQVKTDCVYAARARSTATGAPQLVKPRNLTLASIISFLSLILGSSMKLELGDVATDSIARYSA